MLHPTNNTGNARPWFLSSLTFVILLVAGFGVTAANQRAIADYFLLRNYSPPTAITELATQGKFNDDARKIFYVNRPEVNDRSSFTKSCPVGSREQSIVLGCYQSNQAGIYLLDVVDPRLNGVKQVTAAHEMLHAAYDRLGNKEREDINRQLTDYYKNGLTNERIKQTIEGYKKSEPNDVVNEMHSIFATEIIELPKGLEQYYKRYFTSRVDVAELSERYQAEFTTRRNKVTAADVRLASLKQEIETSETSLRGRQSDINAKQQNLAELRSSNNISAYNAGVPEFNVLITAYNRDVQRVRSLVAQYNALVTERNAIALEEGELVKSLSAETPTINN